LPASALTAALQAIQAIGFIDFCLHVQTHDEEKRAKAAPSAGHKAPSALDMRVGLKPALPPG
jgi:hypothetical protein